MKIKQLNYSKGKVGEDQATNYLVKKGWEIVERNYNCDIGEIDIIAKEGSTIVFVEVKYKSNDVLGIPEEMISENKLNQVKRVATYWLMENRKYKYDRYRIDAVCILGDQLKHYENVGY